jgi:hypothetical protein
MVKIGKYELRRGWFTRRKIIAIAIIVLLVLGYFYWQEKIAFLMRPRGDGGGCREGDGACLY